jgi:hypothetical protein
MLVVMLLFPIISVCFIALNEKLSVEKRVEKFNLIGRVRIVLP